MDPMPIILIVVLLVIVVIYYRILNAIRRDIKAELRGEQVEGLLTLPPLTNPRTGKPMQKTLFD